MTELVDCAGTADWRRSVAEQYPEDKRNLEAAERLEKLDREINSLTMSPEYRKLEEWFEADRDDRDNRGLEFCRIVSEKLKAVGFHSWPESGVELLNDIAYELGRH